MLGSWPASGTRLLEINCGKGYFSPFLEDIGFQVATTGAPWQARRCGACSMPGLTLAAEARDLPFETDDFDWAILHLEQERPEDLAQALEECARISSLGFAVTFWNRLSLALLLRGGCQETSRENATPHPVWRPWVCLGRYHGKKRLGSILMMPESCWNEKSPLAALNSLGQRLPFGAWCVASVEFGERYPLTGLPLRLETGQP